MEVIIRKTGLARALSKLGYCSRSRAGELIRAGRVMLNEKIRRDPETPLPESPARILVDGKPVRATERVYLLLNKPRGVVTTASDEKGRETIYDCLKKNSSDEELNQWLAPVGRLDKASEGLLFLTNDSEWGARVATPQTHLPKTYHVQVGRLVNEEFLGALVKGVHDKHGELLRARKATILRGGRVNCWIEVVLDEGKNRQLRRMMDALNAAVLRLIRVAIGPVRLGNLAKGGHRFLTPEEKRAIDKAMRIVKLNPNS